MLHPKSEMFDDKHPYIGRKLSPAELVKGTVVITHKKGDNHYFTVWVGESTPEYVEFIMNGVEIPIHLILFIRDVDMVDDRGTVIEAFEFLGKP